MKVWTLLLLALLLCGCAQSLPPGEAPAGPSGQVTTPTKSTTETRAPTEQAPVASTDPKEESGTAPAPVPLARGEEVKDFSLTDVHGKTQNLLTLLQKEGVKGAWVTVWDVRCPDCMADLPKMAPTYAGLKKQGLQWIGVAINTSTDQAAQFTEQKGLPFINLVDPDKQVAMGLHTKLTPYTLLLDKHGKVAAVYQGAGKEILAAVKKDATDFLSTGQVKSAPVSSGHG